jgi:hypothetical protein
MAASYIKIYDDGTRSPSRHPGLRTTPVEGISRELDADELADHGYYMVIDAQPPSYNPETERLKLMPIPYWNIVGKRIVQTYKVVPRPLSTPQYVAKSVIVRRLDSVGKLEAAKGALETLTLLQRTMWEAHPSLWSEDPETLAFLRAIGADPAVILAPGEAR